MHKPHIHKGRFYNHHHDSISVRLGHMIKAISSMLSFHLLQRGKRKIIDDANRLKGAWMVKPLIPQRSQELLVTWLGHATVLIQVGNINILTDPVFYPISSFVPRLMPFPLKPDQLPPIDVILISHNHRDHTDKRSLLDLIGHQPRVMVPVGNKQWFTRLGFHDVTEMMWWDQSLLSLRGTSLQLTFLPTAHWTGRGIIDTNKSLWGSWMISHNSTNVYWGGDTAYDVHFRMIARMFPKIQVAILPVGPIEPRDMMAESHLDAEEAIKALCELGASRLIPMHWGTFMFGYDYYLYPIQQLTHYWQQHRDLLATKSLDLIKCGESRVIPVRQPDGMHPDLARTDQGVFL